MRRMQKRRSCDRKDAGGSSLPTAIQDEELMPTERRFRDDGTKATGFYKANDGDDRMNENDEDVVHAGIVSKSQKHPGIQAVLVIRHRQVGNSSLEDLTFKQSAQRSSTNAASLLVGHRSPDSNSRTHRLITDFALLARSGNRR